MARKGLSRHGPAATEPSSAGSHGARRAHPPPHLAIAVLVAGGTCRDYAKGRDPSMRGGSRHLLGKPCRARYLTPGRPVAAQAVDRRRLAKGRQPIAPRRRLEPLHSPACARRPHRGAAQ